MATQTEGQIQTEIKDRIAIYQEIYKMGGINSSGNISNFIAREQTAKNDTEGDYSVLSNNGLAGVRAAVAAAVDKGAWRAVMDPLLLNYAKVVGTIPETDPAEILKRLYIRAVTTGTTFTVKGRNFSFGSVSAGSNIGSGTINRLTVDPFGFNLEAGHVETKQAYCVRDQDTGAALAEEVFLVRGATPVIDGLSVVGSGVLEELTCLSARNALITNASFSQYGGSITSLTDLSGWTPGSGASTFTNLNLDQTNYYRGAGGTSDPTPTALKFLTNESVSQAFSVNGIQLDPDTPIYVQLAYNRSVGSCNGTLTLTCGLDSVSVNVGSAGAGWNILRLPLTKMRYPRNFANMNAPTVTIQLSGRTSGTLLVDDVIMQPFTKIDNLYYAGVGGATPFVGENRDSFSWADTLVGSDSVIQRFFAVVYDFSFPSSTVGAETWTDPSV